MGSLSLALIPADRQARLRNLGLLAVLVAWMLYTRFFWTAKSVHATLPACPFRALTGHPCPFCGGTHSFAYVWQGDLSSAAAVYPLGPLLFAGTVLAILLLVLSLIGGRTLAVRLTPGLGRAVAVAACIPLAVSWGLKLTVLPNPS
jgi:hypothetical protein